MWHSCDLSTCAFKGMAHFYGTTGSNIATESGCSSSMVAVGLACKSLRRHETSLAIACGVNLLLQPSEYEMMAAFCAEDGHCKTFDAAADGFGRAEGCGVLVMKRLSDAIKDGDNIRAVIRGYGEAQEGPSKSLGTPTVEVEKLAMSLALKDAEVLAAGCRRLESLELTHTSSSKRPLQRSKCMEQENHCCHWIFWHFLPDLKMHWRN